MKKLNNSGNIKLLCFCEKWGNGGIESFLHSLFMNVNADELLIDIVTPEFKSSQYTNDLMNIGVNFHQLSGSKYRIFKNLNELIFLLNRENYDIFYLNTFIASSMFYVHVARIKKVPLRIVHSHNTRLRKNSVWFPLKMIIHVINKELFSKDATNLWACSRAAANFMFSKRSLKTQNFTFIPNAIEIKNYLFNQENRKIIREKLGIENNFVIGNVGRLCYQKNQSFLLNILCETLEICPNALLLLIGDGPQRASLEKKAEKLKISNSVIFAGEISNATEYYSAMDVFVLPSKFEGFGRVAIEAQLNGLHTIVSDCVPQEANVIPNIYEICSSKSAIEWARRVVQIYLDSSCRYIEELSCMNIYECKNVAKNIQNFLLRKDNDEKNIT